MGSKVDRASRESARAFHLLVATLACLAAFALSLEVEARGQALTKDDDVTASAWSEQADYLPGQILVKFREAPTSPTLGELSRRFQARSIRLFGDLGSSESLESRIRQVRAKFPRRARRAPSHALMPEGLERIHVVEIEGESIEEALQAFRADPNVEYAQPNYILRAETIPNDPYLSSSGSWGQGYEDLWGLHKIGAPAAWELSRGEGVVVAVVDTGLDYNHPDIWDNVWVNPERIEDRNGDGRTDLDDVDVNGNRIVDPGEIVDHMFGWDFSTLDDDVEDNDPMDGDGHGTHVSGIIAATGDNGTGVAGVAWKSRILAVKGLNDGGFGSTSGLARAVRYAAEMGADVINSSWGGDGLSPVLKEVFDYARGLGVLAVAAAGNDNEDVGSERLCRTSPACIGSVMAVAAFDEHDEKVYFSNWGRKVEVAAPGGNGLVDPAVSYQPLRNILSLRAASTGDPSLALGGIYIRQAGTSMASPHVAGLAALLVARQPGHGTELIRLILQASAVDVGDPGFDLFSGYGRIDALAALRKSDEAPFLPELLIGDIRPERQHVADRSFLPVSLRIDNVGGVDADAVTVELRDGEGGSVLGRFTLPKVRAGTSELLRAHVLLEGIREHRVSATVDPENAIRELHESNNEGSSLVLVSSYNFVERRITWDASDQRSPSISLDRIVWEDYRNGTIDSPIANSDIYLYELSTSEERQITSDPADQWSPRISGDRIVWADGRNGASDIYLHDLSTREEHRLTIDPAQQTSPAIWGDRVVWQSFGDPVAGSDIYLHDLSTGQERRLTSDPGSETSPTISDRWVAWNAYGGNPYSVIHVYDMATGRHHQIPADADPGSGQFLPILGGDRIVWHNVVRFHTDPYLYDLGPDGVYGTSDCNPSGWCEGKFLLTREPSDQLRPSISEDRIVWQDYRHDVLTSEIYLYDLGSDGILGTGDCDPRGRCEGEYRITADPARQTAAAISGERLVWEDQRNGNWDIYMATADDFPRPPGRLLAFRAGAGILLDWDDNQEPDLDGYAIYRSTVEGGPYERIATTPGSSHLDRGLPPGTVYYYVLAAVDRAGGESGISNEAQAATDRAPVLDPIGSRQVAAATLVQFPVTAFDPDGDALVFWAENLPAGASFKTVRQYVAEIRRDARRQGRDPDVAEHRFLQSLPPGVTRDTHLFRWTPSPAQVGGHLMTFAARDGDPSSSREDREAVRVRVLRSTDRRGGLGAGR